MAKIGNGIVFISKKINAISGLIVLLLMILTTVDVISRYLFNTPIRGTYDVSGLMALVIISLALAQTQVEKGHINITLFTDIMPQRIGSWIKAIISFTCLTTSIIVAWQSYLYGLSLFSVGEASQTEKIPFAPFAFTISVGFIILGLAQFIDLIESVKQGLKK